MTEYADVVFLDGEEGREVTDALFNVEGVVAHGVTEESIAAAFEYLKQWDYGDNYGEMRDEIPAGSQDLVIIRVGYVMSANLGLGYVGLSRIIGE